MSATDTTGGFAWFSNRGDWIDVAAPGDGVHTTGLPTWPETSRYVTVAGTSFAAPVVAGTAMLLRSDRPDWSHDRIARALRDSTRDAGPPGADDYYGAGIVDAYAALGGPPAPPRTDPYTVTELPAPAGKRGAGAFITNDGHVAGSVLMEPDRPHTVVWRDGAMADLHEQGIFPTGREHANVLLAGFNDAGDLVGAFETWDRERERHGQCQFLLRRGQLDCLDARDQFHVSALNDHGDVLGGQVVPDQPYQDYRPAIWRDGMLDFLQRMPGSGPGSAGGSAINDTGGVAGSVVDIGSPPVPPGPLGNRPAAWFGGQPRDLGTFGGSGGQAFAVGNRNSLVAGTPTCRRHPASSTSVTRPPGRAGRWLTSARSPPPPRPKPCAQAPPSGFVDVAGNTHEPAIDCVVRYGVAHGVGDGRYAPGRAVSRAQMASFVARTMEAAGYEFPLVGSDRFSDVAGNVHEDNINRAAEIGVVHGNRDGTYRPGAAVRRDQLASFLSRTLDAVDVHVRVPPPGR